VLARSRPPAGAGMAAAVEPALGHLAHPERSERRRQLSGRPRRLSLPTDTARGGRVRDVPGRGRVPSLRTLHQADPVARDLTRSGNRALDEVKSPVPLAIATATR